jgi:hypothetical protein
MTIYLNNSNLNYINSSSKKGDGKLMSFYFMWVSTLLMLLLYVVVPG